MAQLIVRVDDFKLTSTYRCVTYDINYLNPDTNFSTTEEVVTKKTTEAARKASKTVTFSYTLPEGMKAVGAQVHATLSKTSYGAASSTINGVDVGTECEAVVDVELDAESSSVAVPFSFTTKKVSHDHTWNGYIYRQGYYIEQGIYVGTHFAYDHSASLEYSDVYLVIEYVIDNQGWTLTPNVVRPGETMKVELEEVKEGYSYTAQATIGDFSTRETNIPLHTASLGITATTDWLYGIPDAESGSGIVTVREYLDGELMRETYKNFALICPDEYVPSIHVSSIQPLLTVDGVTYPEVCPGMYVQGKCGVEVDGWATSGGYGAYIASIEIDIADGRYKFTTEDGEFSYGSGLLIGSGFTEMIFTATDSRGRSVVKKYQIYVEPYAPPSAIPFEVYRADDNDNKNEHSPYVAYSFKPIYSPLSGYNHLTALLTTDGVKQQVNSPYKGYLTDAAGAKKKFEGDENYTVELTLTDAYGSVVFSAAIKALTATKVIIRPIRKKKRGLIIGDYDTVEDGDWTMSALSFTEPEQQTNFVTVPGRAKGPLDMSTALTDGEPTYGSRILTAKLENSNGTRQHRNELISRMVNQLNGRRWEITLPDDPDRYVVGRVSIKTEYSDVAHCAVTLTATCEPWRYNKLETVCSWSSLLCNYGGMVVVPEIEIKGTGTAMISCAERSVMQMLGAGKYRLTELVLHPGDMLSIVVGDMSYSMVTGKKIDEVTFSYREAVL